MSFNKTLFHLLFQALEPGSLSLIDTLVCSFELPRTKLSYGLLSVLVVNLIYPLRDLV